MLAYGVLERDKDKGRGPWRRRRERVRNKRAVQNPQELHRSSLLTLPPCENSGCSLLLLRVLFWIAAGIHDIRAIAEKVIGSAPDWAVFSFAKRCPK